MRKCFFLPMVFLPKGVNRMKLIIAIVQDDDSSRLINNLMDEGYGVTKLATTGGFLRTGNVTILVGADDEKIPELIEIIKVNSHSRKQMIAPTAEPGLSFYPTMPIEVMVGGATIFVTDIERFEQV